jgi:hypothetical protein
MVMPARANSSSQNVRANDPRSSVIVSVVKTKTPDSAVSATRRDR